AEHRTSPPGDDPEIKPFFDEGSADFDIDAPNDRFGNAPQSNEDPGFEVVEEPGFEESPETVADEPLGFAPEGDQPPRAQPAPHTGRGFNDDFEDNRPPPRNDRGDRDRDRGRGRDRDRGDRGPPR